MEHLWAMGYSAEDLISNIFRVCKNLPIEERLKLDFIRVSLNKFCIISDCEKYVKYIQKCRVYGPYFAQLTVNLALVYLLVKLMKSCIYIFEF